MLFARHHAGRLGPSRLRAWLARPPQEGAWSLLPATGGSRPGSSRAEATLLCLSGECSRVFHFSDRYAPSLHELGHFNIPILCDPANLQWFILTKAQQARENMKRKEE